ncbi:interleukin-31 receptor subunit alpha-like [Xyrichtys novacula]|uniref:Interleukin-31 receptor subunit alpha-like n=1 Tax=Xyrichtys novacula TaxID=13765 RepID=A0AAV1H097_XYRNO|nr:interleukin-31 receptor subunit alpha-like [Xyrichtys novacula]
MSHTGPPPRWRNCPRRGQPVAGKFLPMKTMLGPRYDEQVAEENRFHPSMLSNYLKSLKVKMGLLVDLTNTTRFYDRNDIEKEGIKYVKLQCKGHGECPSKDTTAMFIRLCEHFIEKNPTELIDLLDKKPYNITVTPLFNGKTGHGTQALQICSRVEANVTITNVQAYDKSATVSWDVRSQEVCRGAVVTYTVFYSKQKEPQQNVTVGSTRQYISLKDLTPDTQYHVYVQATTLSGSSNSSEWLFKTKKFDPRLLTALLVCGSITVVLLFILGVCCAVQWRKISEKPIPNPGLSSVALWSSASHQEGTFLVQPFSTPRESWCDRVYPEELEGTFTLLKDYKDKPAKDRAEEFTVPHVVPAPDEQSTYSGESVEMLHPSSPEESTELLLSDSNHSSAYRSQSSEEAPARRTSKQNEGGAVKQLENTAPPTVYVTLDMLKGKAQLKELETKT